MTVAVDAEVVAAAVAVKQAEEELAAARLALHAAWGARSAALERAGYTIEFSHVTHGIPPTLRQVVLAPGGRIVELDTLAG